MAAMSNFLENKLLDHALGTAAYTMPSNVYVALYTAAPSDAGGGTECSGNGYARKAASFNAAASGAADNSAAINFGAPSGGNWGTVTHFGIFDAITAGNLLIHGALTASKVTAEGDPVEFEAGNLDISAD